MCPIQLVRQALFGAMANCNPRYYCLKHSSQHLDVFCVFLIHFFFFSSFFFAAFGMRGGTA